MSNDIHDLHKQAQHFFQSIRNEATRNGKLSLLLADHYYSLQRIKIAVVYRRTTHDLSSEDRKQIEEIRQMFEEASKIRNELNAKSVSL